MSSFLDRLLVAFFGGTANTVADHPMDLLTAVATLLVLVGQHDGVFHPSQQAMIEQVLAEKFKLSSGDSRDVVQRALQAKHSTLQVFRFTLTIRKSMNAAERESLIALLWAVARADGVLDHTEDALIRRVSGILSVP